MSSQMLVQIQAALAQMQSAVDVPVIAASSSPVAGGSSFVDHLGALVHEVDGQGLKAEEKLAAVDRGESDDLVGAMLSSQEASLSFSMMMQVRNKVVGAVDELIKLPL